MRMTFMAAAVAIMPMVSAAQDYNLGEIVDVEKEALEEARKLIQARRDAVFYEGYAIYHGKFGFTQDRTQGMKLLRTGAELEDFRAMVTIAVLFEKGDGVPQDFVTAHMWYNLSSAISDEEGPTLWRENLAIRMTPTDISEAQRRARVCMTSGYEDCD